MCRMAAFSARYPLSLKTFMVHFFLPLIPDNFNKDGWGVAYFADKECLLFKGREPAMDSPLLRAILERVEIKSHQAVLHVRRATKGRVTLANTHPFVRELWGMPWVFAHHGEVKGIGEWDSSEPCCFQPVGETDTEYLFCWLLNALWKQFRDSAPPKAELVSWMKDLVQGADFEKEKFNFILANPSILFVFYGGHQRLFWSTFDKDNPVVQISSTSLYGCNSWQPFRPGELKIIEQGVIKDSL